jgi:type IV pilus assembly protein PilV
LSLVALQATSIQLASDAKYRTDASLLADKLIGQMWASGGTAENLKASFASPDGAAYQTWRDSDVKASTRFPASWPTRTR